MKSTFARRISILLVLAMVLAMLPLGVMAADTATTVYFENNWKWTDVRVHYWGAEESPWPGVAMTNTGKTNGDGTNEIFSAEIPAGCTGILFTGLDNGALKKSNDITDFNSDVIYYMSWNEQDGEHIESYDAKYVFGSEDPEEPVVTDPEVTEPEASEPTEPEVVETITVYVDAVTVNLSGAINAYVWNANGPVLAGWPGSAMTNVSGNVWSIEVPVTATNIIFNNGSLQTKNLAMPTADEMIWNGTEYVDYATYTPSGEEVKSYDFYVAGTLNGWANPDPACGMTDEDGDGIYTFSFEAVAGPYSLKVTNGTWNAGGNWGGTGAGGNYEFDVASDCTVTVTFDSINYIVNVTGAGIGEVTYPAYVVVGNVLGLDDVGNWAFDNGAIMVDNGDGTYSYTFAALAVSPDAETPYEFKIVKDGKTWIPDGDNWKFYVINEASDVTITINAETSEISINLGDNVVFDYPVDPDIPVVEDEYFVKGDVAGLDWDLTTGTGLMTKNEDGSYSLVITDVAVANKYSIKVVKNSSWDGAIGGTGLGGNYEFAVTAVCDVTVTIAADGTLSVTGAGVGEPSAEELVVDSVVIAGGVVDGILNNFLYGQEWIFDSGVNGAFADEGTKIYTATYTNVEAGTYEFRFFLNGLNTMNFASGMEVVPGEEVDAYFNALGNSTLIVTEDGATVELILDLTNVVYVGDNAKMTVNITYPEKVETKAPESLVIGNNEFVIGTGDSSFVTSTFTATESGTLLVDVTGLTMFDAYSGEWSECPAFAIGMQGRGYGLMVNGESCWPSGSVEVVAGETYEIAVASFMGNASYITVTLAYYVPTCDHIYAYSFDTANNLHTFTCDNCGDVFTKAGTSATALKFRSAAPLLGDCINVEFGIFVPEGFENPYVIFEFNGNESYEDAYYVNASGRNVYEFKGINPQTIGDNICSTVYAFVDGELVYLTYATYSVRTYCINQLAKATTPAALKTLIADLLIFGEKTQIMQSYKLDQMITEGVDLSAYASTFPGLGTEFNKQAMVGTANSNVGFKGVTLTLSGKMTIVVSLTADDISKYTFQTEVNGVVTTYQPEDLVYNATSGRYELSFDKMKASAFDDVITFSILENGVVTSKQLQYTVNTYIQKNQAVATGDMLALLQAIYNYGAAAKALNG